MNGINLLVEGVEVVVEGVVGVNGLGFVGEAGARAAAEVAVNEWGAWVATLRFAALLWVVEVVVEDAGGGLLGRLRLVPGPWDHFYEVFEHLAPAIDTEALDEALAQRLLGWESVETSVEEEVEEEEEFDWLNASAEEFDAELDRLEAIERARGWDGEPELSEYEQGWANIRAEERAAVARQVAEDAEWERRPRSSYQGVEGRWNPEDGWIYEP